MRKLGIIGGTAWSSTMLYYEHINREIAQRLGGLHSALLAIDSLDFAEFAQLQRANDWAGVATMYREAGRRLVAAGADAVLMACNTSHKVYDELAATVDVPVLHIGDAAAHRLAADGRQCVAVLGTRFTMTEPFVRSRIEARDIEVVVVQEPWIREVDRIIFEELAMGRVVSDSRRKLKTLITELGKQGVEAIVLACTELVLAVDATANVLPIYDTTAIHARAGVDWMLADEEQARVAA